MEPGLIRQRKLEKIQQARDGKINIFTLLYKIDDIESKMLIKHFIRFLMSNNAYEVFIQNLLSEENISWLTFHMPFGNPAFIIESGFKWSSAIGGPTKWAHLSGEWQSYVRNYKVVRRYQCKKLYGHGNLNLENGLGIWYTTKTKNA